MQILRRILRWTVFLGFLGAVGFGVFHFVRYRPRFTIPELLFVTHLSADGSRLVTLKGPRLNRVHDRGPVQVWDTQRGRLEYEFLADMPAWFQFSDDGAIIAVGSEDGTLRLIDWRSGCDWQIEDVKVAPFTQLPERAPWPRHWFSARGRWLFVDAAGEQPTCIINVATRQVVLSLKEKLLQLSTDGRLAFVRNEANIDVWDLEAVKRVATLAAGPEDWITVSPDDRTLLTRRVLPPPAPMHVSPVHGIELWDLASFTVRLRRELSPAGYWRATFSADSRTLALWSFTDLALFDANTGRLLGAHKVEQCNLADFSADGSLWFMRHGGQFDERLTMLDAASGRVLWERPGQCSYEFIGDAGIAHQERGKAVQLIDARSGEVMAVIPNSSAARDDPEAWLLQGIQGFTQCSDRRHFVFAGRQRRNREPHIWDTWLEKWSPNVFGDDVPALVVMESATGRELLRLANAGNQPISLMLSEDASTLVTVDGFDDRRRSMVRVWDVGPTRAWVWAIATALSMGMGMLSIRWLWRRRAKPKSVQ